MRGASLIIDYSSESPDGRGQLREPNAATTPPGALADYFDVAQGHGSGFADSTFNVEWTLDSGAVEFAAVVDGATRAIATADHIGGDFYWAVTAIRGCESDKRSNDEVGTRPLPWLTVADLPLWARRS